MGLFTEVFFPIYLRKISKLVFGLGIHVHTCSGSGLEFWSLQECDLNFWFKCTHMGPFHGWKLKILEHSLQNFRILIHFKKLSYSLCRKKRTFNSKFFRGPLGEGGQKFIWSITHAKLHVDQPYSMYDFGWCNLEMDTCMCRTSLYKSAMWILGPPPPGGPRKKSELNVFFFTQTVYAISCKTQQSGS